MCKAKTKQSKTKKKTLSDACIFVVVGGKLGERFQYQLAYISIVCCFVSFFFVCMYVSQKSVKPSLSHKFPRCLKKKTEIDLMCRSLVFLRHVYLSFYLTKG